MYSSTTSFNNGYASNVIATTQSPQRTVTTSIVGNPAPVVGHTSSHDIDPYGDAIVSYGVDELGEPVRITSTGILHGPEIRTFTERIAPGETHTSSHVSHNVLNPFETEVNTTTTTDVVSPSRYLKTTTYSSPTRQVHHEFAPLEQPVTNTTSTTTTRRVASPSRQVTTTYHAPMSPVRQTVVAHSPVRQVTVMNQSPVRSYSTVYNALVERTVVTQRPAQQYVSNTIVQSPARQVTTSYTHASPVQPVMPVQQNVVTTTQAGLQTSTYSSGRRTTTIVNDLPVKSRVDMMLEETRARLGTERVVANQQQVQVSHQSVVQTNSYY